MGILMYVLAAILFGSAWIWLIRSSGTVTPSARLRETPWRGLILAALLAQTLGLLNSAGFLGQVVDGWHFGFAQALSACALLSTLLLAIDRNVAGLPALWRLLLPLCVSAVLLAMLFPGAKVDAARPWFAFHLVLAVFSYSLILLAVGIAILMMTAEKSLHHPGASAERRVWIDELPPLMVLERLMFRVITTGFVALTLTLISGVLFSEEVFGRAMRFDHKTVFAIAAWLVFAVLLAGRALRGWRGRVAMRFTLGGFGLLVLAYLGTRFVLEVVLQRVPG
jgi:ABC-type uncharacterized transport system permease subunit